jgi:hypothetical protein
MSERPSFGRSGLSDPSSDVSCPFRPYRAASPVFGRPNVHLSDFKLSTITLKPSRNDVPDDCNTSLGSQGAFPDCRNPPTSQQQRRSNGTVPRHIRAELRLPEFRACCRSACVTAARVPVPEAPVHEDDGLVFRQHEIRLAGYALGMEPIAKAQRMQGLPEGQFRLRVLSADASHHPGTGLAVDDVGHLPPGLGRWTWYTAYDPNSRGL